MNKISCLSVNTQASPYLFYMVERLIFLLNFTCSKNNIVFTLYHEVAKYLIIFMFYYVLLQRS